MEPSREKSQPSDMQGHKPPNKESRSSSEHISSQEPESSQFRQQVDPESQELPVYCCELKRKLAFNPPVLYCIGKPLCSAGGIPRGATYYSYKSRYIYCQKCFGEISCDQVTIGDDPLTPTIIPKSYFKEMKNDSIAEEPVVACIHCKRDMHSICVLHMDEIHGGGFQCDDCLKSRGLVREENKFSAKQLQTTKLSTFLEERINTFLRTCTEDRAKYKGPGNITIRVVSSADKIMETKPLMKKRFGSDFPSQFPYRAKAIFVFDAIDGADVCIFGMHVHEYGSGCPAPNSRCVYLSCLDSVKLSEFKPGKLFQVVILSYLEFCRNHGFSTAYIWGCSHSERGDCIFHSIPPKQQIPEPKMLASWYKRILDVAKSEDIIYDYKDLFEHCSSDGYKVTGIPYLEGDFWPAVIEEAIKELDQEHCDSNENTSKAVSETEKFSSTQDQVHGDIVTDKIFGIMDKYKNMFFAVLLCEPTPDQAPSPGDTTDPDPLIMCDLMDGQDAFLTTARERNWEFSSLRNAKYSTMALLYEIYCQSDVDKETKELREHARRCIQNDCSVPKCIETKESLRERRNLQSLQCLRFLYQRMEYQQSLAI